MPETGSERPTIVERYLAKIEKDSEVFDRRLRTEDPAATSIWVASQFAADLTQALDRLTAAVESLKASPPFAAPARE
jgi:hypothetical protein